MKTPPSKPKGRRAADRAATPDEPEFPSVRYFQIHFEHLEGLLLDTRQHLDALRQQLSEVRQMADSLGPPRSERHCEAEQADQ
jgi:hypothetical protein